jgi:hypothetical protein
VQPVLPFTPVASKIEEQAIELAQEFAFLGRQGTSPNAVQLAVPFMLDLLNAGVAHAIIIAEMKRGDRMISEHPGRLRDRLLPPKEKQRGSRTTDHGDFDPNRTDYPSAQPGKDAG